ncbi:DUF302 domain-containing protein [Aequorivita sp. H23M31]|uniref:DUF302 domain-containing protein n=1 Tax=Aequorivita ciconiae TaxID=2494375 RepID=A0A410G624_9FLAO|nr:DUF302 domain-containing protein [Aequorivita sp. H23M31]QAA82719.1 DUF302 domain-containing protein [Aequorivita sp. H23M31]
MQNIQSVSIDLPMKVMVWENEDGIVNIGYNTIEWLKRRHNLRDDEALRSIEEAVMKICTKSHLPS